MYFRNVLARSQVPTGSWAEGSRRASDGVSLDDSSSNMSPYG